MSHPVVQRKKKCGRLIESVSDSGRWGFDGYTTARNFGEIKARISWNDSTDDKFWEIPAIKILIQDAKWIMVPKKVDSRCTRKSFHWDIKRRNAAGIFDKN